MHVGSSVVETCGDMTSLITCKIREFFFFFNIKYVYSQENAAPQLSRSWGKSFPSLKLAGWSVNDLETKLAWTELPDYLWTWAPVSTHLLSFVRLEQIIFFEVQVQSGERKGALLQGRVLGPFQKPGVLQTPTSLIWIKTLVQSVKCSYAALSSTKITVAKRRKKEKKS